MALPQELFIFLSVKREAACHVTAACDEPNHSQLVHTVQPEEQPLARGHDSHDIMMSQRHDSFRVQNSARQPTRIPHSLRGYKRDKKRPGEEER